MVSPITFFSLAASPRSAQKKPNPSEKEIASSMGRRAIFFQKKNKKCMFSGHCQQCSKDAEGKVSSDGFFYCHDCWEFYDASFFRCITFAAVYDECGRRLTSATSLRGCAERNALWKLSSENIHTPKTLIVARINRKGSLKRFAFGDSKPCMYCAMAFKTYNIQRVGYSRAVRDTMVDGSSFNWKNAAAIEPTLRSKSSVIVRMYH